MKKLFRNALLVLAGVAAVGCTNDVAENIAPEQKGEMVTVLLEVGGDTRTTLAEDLSVNWNENDQIRVEYDDAEGNYGIAEPATIVSCEGNKATFAITLPAGFEDKALYAIYPYWAGGWGGWNDQIYSAYIKSEQPFVDGSFANGSNLSVAVMNWTGTGYKAKFVNVGGLIRVPVSGDVKVKSMTVKALGGEKMSGSGTIYNVSEDGCTWDGTGNAANSDFINVVSDEAIDLATEKTFVVVAPAQTYASGLSFTFTNEAGDVYTYTVAESKELKRAGVIDIEPLTLNAADFGAASADPLVGEYAAAERVASQWKAKASNHSMTKTIMDKNSATFGSPSGGQKYAIGYSQTWADGILYFDLATEANADGTINLINLQDRASGGDQITHNASYYDPATGNVHFEFIILGHWAPGGAGGTALNPGDDTPGEVYCFNLLKEAAKHPIVGEYTIAEGTSAFKAARPGHQMNTTIYDSSYEKFGAPKDGQQFCVNYNSGWADGLLYFDLAESANADGTYNLINLIDRAAGYDQITQNGSWYNPTTGVVHFDFIILGWSAPGGGGGGAVEEGNEAGYLYCYDFTPAAE